MNVKYVTQKQNAILQERIKTNDVYSWISPILTKFAEDGIVPPHPTAILPHFPLPYHVMLTGKIPLTVWKEQNQRETEGNALSPPIVPFTCAAQNHPTEKK